MKRPLLAAGWLAACLAATYVLMRADFIPGPLGPSLQRWPDHTALTRAADRLTVAVFLHPRCVCSKATVAQLVRLAHEHPQAAGWVAAVFVPPPPEGAAAVWRDNDHVQQLRANIPGVRIVYDEAGQEAQRFGAWTSGTVLVYDAQGREMWRGGVTDHRGGRWDNLGVRRLAQMLAGLPMAATGAPSPVYGCALVSTAVTQPMEGR